MTMFLHWILFVYSMSTLPTVWLVHASPHCFKYTVNLVYLLLGVFTCSQSLDASPQYTERKFMGTCCIDSLYGMLIYYQHMVSSTSVFIYRKSVFTFVDHKISIVCTYSTWGLQVFIFIYLFIYYFNWVTNSVETTGLLFYIMGPSSNKDTIKFNGKKRNTNCIKIL